MRLRDFLRVWRSVITDNVRVRFAFTGTTFIAENTLVTKPSLDNLERRIKGGGIAPRLDPEDRVFMLMHTRERTRSSARVRVIRDAQHLA